MRAILTPDDLKKGDLVETGWWPTEIVDYVEAPAKTDGSTNCIFHFKILDGPSKGASVQRLFNEKAMGFAKNLLASVGYPKTPEGGYDVSTDLLKQMVNKKVKIYIKRGKNQTTGAEFNEVADFQPLS